MFQNSNIKKILILSTLIVFIFSAGTLNIGFNKVVFAAGHSSGQSIPKVSLEHNGGIVDLLPLVNIKNKILNKLNTPEDEETNSTIYAINMGDKISFNFDKKPARVDAFLIDYENEYTTLYGLEKTSTGEFIVNPPSPGLYNAEVHVLYPDGRYTSYSKIMNVVDTNNEVDLLKLTAKNNACVNELKLDKVFAIGNPTTNLLSGILNQPIIKELSLGAIDQLKIAFDDSKDVCGLRLGIANSQNNIHFFAVQGSKDDKKYTDPIIFSNTGFSGQMPEIYRSPASMESKFLKIIPLGSTLETGLGIMDLKIFGN